MSDEIRQDVVLHIANRTVSLIRAQLAVHRCSTVERLVIAQSVTACEVVAVIAGINANTEYTALEKAERAIAIKQGVLGTLHDRLYREDGA
jgi:hypothetical protein